jgi:hypothetical protein
MTGLAGYGLEMALGVRQKAVSRFRVVAGLAIGGREAMVRLLQVFAHGFPPRFAAQERGRGGGSGQALGIIGGVMAIGALQQFAGVNIPGEIKMLFAGQVEEGSRDLLWRKDRAGRPG